MNKKNITIEKNLNSFDNTVLYLKNHILVHICIIMKSISNKFTN